MMRFTAYLDRDEVERLKAINAQGDLSVSEQIRRAIRLWVKAREWPRTTVSRAAPSHWG